MLDRSVYVAEAVLKEGRRLGQDQVPCVGVGLMG